MATVTQNEDGTVTVQLQSPIATKLGGIASVTLRTDCTVADLEEMDGASGDVERTKRMISALSCIGDEPGISLAALRKMRASDYLALAAEVGKIISGNVDGAETAEDDGGGKAFRETGGSS